MANYEYQESDIMFPEHGHQGGEGSSSNYLVWPPQPQRKSSIDVGKSRENNKKKKKKLSNYSSPICIPEGDHFEWGDGFEAAEEEETEVVPPHLIVARRVATNMEFSVCSGKGRTLRGRDLKEVRNEILRMTGFLEANWSNSTNAGQLI